MTDRPILFSAPMVRALLEGRKTQTRRILNPQPFANGFHYSAELGDILCHNDYLPPSALLRRVGKGKNSYVASDLEGGAEGMSGYYVGDRLYVREEWFTTPAYDDLAPSEMGGDEPLRYKADDATFNWTEADGSRVGRRRAGMHMPRWASRLTLTVTDVRVARLQDCSEADALAEGIGQFGRFFGLPDADWDEGELSAVAAYHRLWNSINGPGSWEANPWVVAVTFAVENRNIDA
ncbi:hypothetical protein [Sphingopyxis sp. 113P3]|uniref:hypothetical protein n=1 Tax=Sphingopyxis sp. (strain 113P3) TaxID=292913 RepID=UPI0006AD35C0|nr:hypothetical protein [Sphingopyxis sp. 113P3]ALC12529.1 hypothetical protein LH20_11255 [Sphingopyxis sp. 113P3]